MPTFTQPEKLSYTDDLPLVASITPCHHDLTGTDCDCSVAKFGTDTEPTDGPFLPEAHNE